MAQAYDFALDKMGLDIQSFSLWSDYIKFLKVQIALLITSSLLAGFCHIFGQVLIPTAIT